MSVINHLDHASLAPVYTAAGAAVLVFVADVIMGPRARWRAGIVTTLAVLGAAATAVVAVTVTGATSRRSFCVPAGRLLGDHGSTIAVARSCSYATNGTVVAWIVAAAALTGLALVLSAPMLRAHGRPESSAARAPGEYCFLLLCSLAGSVVLVGARDLVTLVVALETLTLPLYVLVAFGSRARSAASGAATFFVSSIIATAVTLLGVGLLYALTGALHFDRIAHALDARGELDTLPLAAVASVLVVAGLCFKLAAVPFHNWAPTSYDAAPLPTTLFLATVSTFGGFVALTTVVMGALRPQWSVVAPLLAVIAVATMTIGNLMALRQRRMVRLLGWSSVAHAGYVLAPLGALAGARVDRSGAEQLLTASWAYFALYVVITVGVFACLIALRPDADGGELAHYRGLARRSPLATVGLIVGLAGLAGLPPGLAGLFAKVAVVRVLTAQHVLWLALIVVLNTVVGLAYYGRVMWEFFRPALPDLLATGAFATARPRWIWGIAMAATAGALIIGFLPQPLLHAAADWSTTLSDLWR